MVGEDVRFVAEDVRLVEKDVGLVVEDVRLVGEDVRLGRIWDWRYKMMDMALGDGYMDHGIE